MECNIVVAPLNRGIIDYRTFLGQKFFHLHHTSLSRIFRSLILSSALYLFFIILIYALVLLDNVFEDILLVDAVDVEASREALFVRLWESLRTTHYTSMTLFEHSSRHDSNYKKISFSLSLMSFMMSYRFTTTLSLHNCCGDRIADGHWLRSN